MTLDELLTTHLQEIKAGHDTRLREGVLRLINEARVDELHKVIGIYPTVVGNTLHDYLHERIDKLSALPKATPDTEETL